MKSIFVVLAFFWCVRATGQQKYVEVTVSDTVLVKPDLFVYGLEMTASDDATDYTMTRKSHQPVLDLYRQRILQEKSRFDSLKSALKAAGFAVYRSSLGDSVNVLQSDVPVFMARVITRSVDSLGMLSQKLRNVKGLRGYLQAVVATRDSAFQDALFRKMLRQARTKAESIAAFTDLHIRGVLAVTEDKNGEGETGGWTSYPPLSALAESVIPGWHTTISGPSNIVAGDFTAAGWYPLNGRITVRFWVE
ncbi:MAG TPA: hypothetical protein VMH27_21150 [Puia sp.]|nr:hypothetical protein [Puia sp.]